MALPLVSGCMRILVDSLCFPNAHFWLSDMSPDTTVQEAFGPFDISVKVALVDRVPVRESFRSQRMLIDGKWYVEWRRTEDQLAVSWTLRGEPTNSLTVSSRLSGGALHFDISGTDEDFLGKTLRYIIVMPQLISRDLMYLHGSVITRNDKVVLLVGPTGSGKTTYTYTAFRDGWDVLAEDFVLLRSNLIAKRFFSTVRWQCRMRPEDIDIVNQCCKMPDTADRESGVDFLQRDSRGRVKIYPLGSEHSQEKGEISRVVLLDSQACLAYSNGDMRVSHLWLSNELEGRISLRALFDLFGVNFDVWRVQVNNVYRQMQDDLPAFRVEKTGDLSKDLIRFLYLLREI